MILLGMLQKYIRVTKIHSYTNSVQTPAFQQNLIANDFYFQFFPSRNLMLELSTAAHLTCVHSLSHNHALKSIIVCM